MDPLAALLSMQLLERVVYVVGSLRLHGALDPLLRVLARCAGAHECLSDG